MTEGMCNYRYYDKETCDEKVYGASSYCILHIEFPDKSDPGYDKTKSEKDAKVREKVANRDFNFEGTKICSINLSGKDIIELNFRDATISGNALFAEATIEGTAWFDGITIAGNAWFTRAAIGGDITFRKVWEKLEYMR